MIVVRIAISFVNVSTVVRIAVPVAVASFLGVLVVAIPIVVFAVIAGRRRHQRQNRYDVDVVVAVMTCSQG